MNRFLVGLLGGGAGAGITWLVSDGNVAWTVAIGVIIAVLIWFWEFLDEVIP